MGFVFFLLPVLVGSTLVLVSVVGALIYSLQKWFLYIPQAGFKKRIWPWDKQISEDAPTSGAWSQYRSPTQHGLSYEEFFLDTSDGKRLHSWFIKSPVASDTRPTIIFMHGNAGSIALRLPFFAGICFGLDVNIFAVDYRGYGYSKGSPSEEGLIIDCKTVMDFIFCHRLGNSGRQDFKDLIHQRSLWFDSNKVFLFGRSLGGAVSVAALSRFQEDYPLRGFILENTFLSIKDLVEQFTKTWCGNFLTKFVSIDQALITHWLLKTMIIPAVVSLRWKSKDRIAALSKPGLFLSSRLDELVPPMHMDKLYENFISNDLNNKLQKSRFVKFPRGRHNNTWRQNGYYDAIGEFVDDCLAK